MIKNILRNSTVNRLRGFSLVEVLVAVAVLGVTVGVATFFVGTRESVVEIKLSQDVSALNKAVKVYVASGGVIGEDWEAAQVVAELKKRATYEDEKRLVGMSGSLIDLRMGVVMETEEEAESGAMKALWLPEARRFEVTNSSQLGVREFVLDDDYIPSEQGRDDRATALLYAENSSWIWDYIGQSSSRPGFGLTPSLSGGGLDLTANPNSPGPLGEEVQPLSPPTFSHSTGDYPYYEFDLPVVISAAENVPGTYEIFYSVDNEPFESNAGSPVMISRGGSIMAFAKSLDPVRYSDSSSSVATYGVEPDALDSPSIATNYDYFDLVGQGQIVVSIDVDESALPRVIRYRVDGGLWIDYGSPFVLNIADYPSGADIEAAAFGLESWVIDSAPVTKLLKVKLAPPEFAVVNEEDVEASVAISDLNAAGTSQVVYRWGTLPSVSYNAESAYDAPLAFNGEDYPDGVRVATRAVAQSGRFIDSDEVAVDVFLVDPNDWELEGMASATFSDPQGGAGMVVSFANDDSLFSWGTAALPSFPSSVEFSGAEFSGVRPGMVFKVGDISYYNGTIYGGTQADAVDFEIEIAFENDRSVVFGIPVELVNVPNYSYFSPDEAADFLRIPNNEVVQEIRVYGSDYRVAIAFGGSIETSGSTTLTQFHVWEGQTASAEVFGAILEQDASTSGVLNWMRGQIRRYNE